MADNELEETIEQLEAEVLAELEEASADKDPQKKGATSAQKGDKVVDKVSGATQDGGAPVVDPEASGSPTDVAAKDAKEIQGDPQQKGEDPAEKGKGKLAMPDSGKVGALKRKLAKEDNNDDEDDDDDEVKAKKDAEDEEEDDEAMEAKKEAIEDRIKNINVEEDVRALMNADDSLSDEFKTKASTIFEAAVKSRVRSEIERIHEEVSSEKDAEMGTFKDELSEKVDTYLNYVVEEWNKENELAIERGLKGEIAEDFISGLKQLFEDHYIDVPDEKYNILEAQSEKISELENKLNEAMQKNIDISESNSVLVREQVIAEVSEDLADTEFEKFKSLIDDVEFGDEKSFKEKLNTLKESYFPKTIVDRQFDDEDGGTAQDIDTTEAMDAYMSAISRNKQRAQ